jgi:hypothetical protein
VGTGVGGTFVSVAVGTGACEEGVSVGVADGADRVDGADGDGVGEGKAATPAWVGGIRAPALSSWLSRKLPNSIATLMNVMTRLLSSCPASAA